MKGANTLPWLNTINKPNITIMITVGNNQNFFLAIKNLKSSIIVDIYTLILKLYLSWNIKTIIYFKLLVYNIFILYKYRSEINKRIIYLNEI